MPYGDPYSTILEIERLLQRARIDDALSEIRVWTALLRGITLTCPDASSSVQGYSNLKESLYRRVQVALSQQRSRLESAHVALMKLGTNEMNKLVTIISSIQVRNNIIL